MFQCDRRDFCLRRYEYFIVIFLFLVSMVLQQNQFFNWDAGWHLEAAKRMLHGATFSDGLFDDNLPMTYWFFVPAVLAHHYCGFNKVFLANLTVELSFWVSFFLARPFLKIIYFQSKVWEFFFIQYAIVFFLLFFCSGTLAQRDIIVSIFFLPYLVLCGARLEGQFFNCQSHYFLRLLSGVFLGIACGMNPFFLLIVIVLEMQFFLKQKKLSLTPEIVSLVIFCLFYFSVMAIYYRDYYTVVIPSFLAFSPAFGTSYFKLLGGVFSLIVLLYIALYFFYKKTMMHYAWISVLWIAAVISFVLFLLQKKIWIAHILFSVFCVFLMAVVMCCLFLKTRIVNIRIYIMGFFSSIFIPSCIILSSSILINVIYLYHHNAGALNRFITYFNRQPPGSTLYTFSINGFAIGNLMAYTKMDNITPWPTDWMLPVSSDINTLRSLRGWKLAWVNRYKKIFIERSIEDLKNKRPNYVFIEVTKTKEVAPVDFFALLNNAPEFSILWRNYHLEMQVPSYDGKKLRSIYYVYKYK